MNAYKVIFVIATVAAIGSLFAAPKLQGKRNDRNAISFAEIQYMQLKDSDVLMSVNGYKITKEYIERRMSLLDELSSLKNKRRAKMNTGRMKLRRIKRIRTDIAIERVLCEHAALQGITPTSDEIAEELNTLVKRYYPDYIDSTYKFYAKISKENRAAAREYVRTRATLAKIKSAIEGDIAIPDAELEKAKAENVAYNLKARKALAGVWNTASNDWKSVKADGNFDALVKKYEKGKNDHIYSDPEWGVFDLGFFRDDPQVIRALNGMKKGDVSEPVLGDSGLLILKLTDYEEFTDDDGGKERRFHLAQIFYELPVIRTEDEGEIRAEMIKSQKRKNYDTKLKELVDSAKIEYPSGKPFLK